MDSKHPIEIIKHGTSYDKKRDIQEMYPICKIFNSYNEEVIV